MQFIVMKVGPNTVAFYGPFTRDQAINRAGSINDGLTEWSASVQPLHPET